MILNYSTCAKVIEQKMGKNNDVFFDEQLFKVHNCRCGKACCHILVSTSSKEVEDYRVELRVLLTRAKNTKDPMRPRASLIALCSRFLCLFLLNP
jgi:hypothetical protein